MFGSNSRVATRAFARQFEPEGDGYLYHRRSGGPAVHVTAAERDRFLTEFERRWKTAFWAFVTATVLAMVGACVAIFKGVPLPVVLLPTILVWLAYCAVLMRIGKVPDKPLIGRPPF